MHGSRADVEIADFDERALREAEEILHDASRAALANEVQGPIQFGLGALFSLFLLASVFFVLVTLSGLLAAGYAALAAPALLRTLLVTRYATSPLSGRTVFSIFAQSFAALLLSAMLALSIVPASIAVGALLGAGFGEGAVMFLIVALPSVTALVALYKSLRVFWAPWPPTSTSEAAFGSFRKKLRSDKVARWQRTARRRSGIENRARKEIVLVAVRPVQFGLGTLWLLTTLAGVLAAIFALSPLWGLFLGFASALAVGRTLWTTRFTAELMSPRECAFHFACNMFGASCATIVAFLVFGAASVVFMLGLLALTRTIRVPQEFELVALGCAQLIGIAVGLLSLVQLLRAFWRRWPG